MRRLHDLELEPEVRELLATLSAPRPWRWPWPIGRHGASDRAADHCHLLGCLPMDGQDVPASHVFISYRHEDSVKVDWLQAVLEDAGIRVWRDKANLWPGDDWRVVIRRAISEGTLVFLACFSTASMARRQSWQN